MKLMTSEAQLRRRLIRSVAFGAVFFALVIASFWAVQSGPRKDLTPAPLRQVLETNSEIWQALSCHSRNSVTKPAPAAGRPPRVNGDIGLASPIDLNNFEVEVDDGAQQFSFKVTDLTALPRTEVSTEFKCVEGWSEVVQYAGIRFTDFMAAYHIGKKPDGTSFKYVGLETPDGDYYVSLDMASMEHQQTLLAVEMNHSPLSLENGAPLRLIIPIKYGIKSIKRIGTIFFSDERPRDYWADRGYDWFAGL